MAKVNKLKRKAKYKRERVEAWFKKISDIATGSGPRVDLVSSKGS